MSTITPPYLQPGDVIGITCPAGYVSYERIAYAIEVLQSWGFGVKVGSTVGKGENYFAGSDAERLADLQDMLDDTNVKAILMGRGGYGTSRIIDQVDFTTFKQQPKWICGFSDIVVLHNQLQATMNIASLHAPMCGAFTPDSENEYYIQSLKTALTGGELSYSFPSSAYNRSGNAEAVLVGGNLAILAHLTGSESQLNTEGKILFIEDIGEHLYHVDRMLLTLKRSGQLGKIAGLLVGSFTDIEDTTRPFGMTLEEIIQSHVAGYSFPVAFNVPCGHDTENITLKLGVKHKLYVGNGNSMLATIG